MYTFLRNYRATPHTATKMPPATAMIGREINIGLPQISNGKTTAIQRPVKANDVAAKQSMKTYADEHRHTRHANITIGDKVLIMEKRNGRKSFSPNIYTVMRKTGSQIRAQREQHVVTSNSSFFKVVHCREEEEDETREYEFDNVVECRQHQQHHVQRPVREEQRPVRDRRPPSYLNDYRPLSRRLDRYDRVIQNESRDPFGGNACTTSQCKLRSLRANSGIKNVICIVM